MYLNCHTCYSLRYGTLSELDLLGLARENGVRRLALTDINNTSACLNFVRRAPEYEVTPVLGIDFRNGVQPCFIGLAKNNEGYRELNAFLSEHLHAGRDFASRAPRFEQAWVVYPFESVLLNEQDQFEAHEFIGISIRDLRRLPFSRLIHYRDRLVLRQPVTFRGPRDFNLHRLLRAIDQNTLLSKLPESELAYKESYMYPIGNIAEVFAEYPFILENTERLMRQCEIQFEFGLERPPQNQESYTGSTAKDEVLLERLCREGLPYRYPEVTPEIGGRIRKELELIKAKGFVSYFLINWDIVSYARKRDFHYVGRGSGANSIVAYLLRITDVDPMELDLYFERFINLYRSNPPDFDIDFSWKDREEVTRYIFDRFPHVCLLGSYVTFQENGILRELGKVFGLPKEEIDALGSGNRPLSGGKNDHIVELILRYMPLLKDLPNYLSIHASGILISQRPIHYFGATHLPPKGFPTTQFDMIVAEDVGLYKFDILGQRGLAKIKETLEILRYNRPKEAEDIDIHDIRRFKTDPRVNELVRTAQCMGCFYVESPAMRMLLKKLEVDNYLGLVAASSIIRPGVSRSGMMREYILRHRDPERARERAHPVMLDIMPDTYGVMVYQEDVIKVAHHFAGLDPGEADVLRRGMSGKYRSREEFEKIREKFIRNCRSRGYKEELISEVWEQVASFAGYAFAKGHSASYAVESYQSLFLRAYFPLEYAVAVLNNGGGFYRPEFYIHDARMQGADIQPPCINRSFMVNRIHGLQIFLGFMYVRELEQRLVDRILRERQQNGSFSSLEDFLDRIHVPLEQLRILIRANAFRALGTNKHELLWKAHLLLSKDTRVTEQPKLFKARPPNFSIPRLNMDQLEEAFEQIELLGFPLCSPFELLEHPPEQDLGQKDLATRLGKSIDLYGYLVTVKPTRTHKGERMSFATFVDQQGAVFDAVLFPPVAAKYPFRGRGVYRVRGKVTSEFDFLSVEVNFMQKEAYIPDPRYSDPKGNAARALPREKRQGKG